MGVARRRVALVNTPCPPPPPSHSLKLPLLGGLGAVVGAQGRAARLFEPSRHNSLASPRPLPSPPPPVALGRKGGPVTMASPFAGAAPPSSWEEGSGVGPQQPGGAPPQHHPSSRHGKRGEGGEGGVGAEGRRCAREWLRRRRPRPGRAAIGAPACVRPAQPRMHTPHPSLPCTQPLPGRGLADPPWQRARPGLSLRASRRAAGTPSAPPRHGSAQRAAGGTAHAHRLARRRHCLDPAQWCVVCVFVWGRGRDRGPAATRLRAPATPALPAGGPHL